MSHVTAASDSNARNLTNKLPSTLPFKLSSSLPWLPTVYLRRCLYHALTLTTVTTNGPTLDLAVCFAIALCFLFFFFFYLFCLICFLAIVFYHMALFISSAPQGQLRCSPRNHFSCHAQPLLTAISHCLKHLVPFSPCQSRRHQVVLASLSRLSEHLMPVTGSVALSGGIPPKLLSGPAWTPPRELWGESLRIKNGTWSRERREWVHARRNEWQAGEEGKTFELVPTQAPFLWLLTA